jgi:hypothetical protein
MRRLTDREYHEMMNTEVVRKAMQLRCEETGDHDYENCCSWNFQVYQECRWCGARR